MPGTHRSYQVTLSPQQQEPGDGSRDDCHGFNGREPSMEVNCPLSAPATTQPGLLVRAGSVWPPLSFLSRNCRL